MHLTIVVWLALAALINLSKCQFDSGMSGSRTVIANLFQWPFKDIKEECQNVLGPQGFGGVLVSPVTENRLVKFNLNGKMIRPWWEKYQLISWEINSRLGDEAQFRDMVSECNKNDVRVYVDVIINHGVSFWHQSDSGSVEGVAGNKVNVLTKNYPDLGFDSSNFHPTCEIIWSDKTSVRNCELFLLQDLNQTQPYVQTKIASFLNKLIDYGVAGFRVDAAKHIWPRDLLDIHEMLHNFTTNDKKVNIRPYMMLEVPDVFPGSYVEEYKDIGSLYDSQMSWIVTKSFSNNRFSLAKIYSDASNPLYRSKVVQVSAMNHDMERDQEFRNEFHITRQMREIINAFVLSFPRGVPNVFSSFKFNDVNEGPPSDDQNNILSASACSSGWNCEHRSKPFIWVMKFFTNFLKDIPIEKWWSISPNQAAFSRGTKGFAVFNAEPRELRHTFSVSLAPGVYCDLATGYYCMHHKMCMGTLRRQFEVKKDGSLEIVLPPMRFNTYDTESYIPSYVVISERSKVPEGEEPSEFNQKLGWFIIGGVAIVLVLALVAISYKYFFKRRSQSNMEKI